MPPNDPVPKGSGTDLVLTIKTSVHAPGPVGTAGVARESATGHSADRMRIKRGKTCFRTGPGAALTVTAVTSAPTVLKIGNHKSVAVRTPTTHLSHMVVVRVAESFVGRPGVRRILNFEECGDVTLTVSTPKVTG